MAETLARATPIILTGLAAATVFRAKFGISVLKANFMLEHCSNFLYSVNTITCDLDDTFFVYSCAVAGGCFSYRRALKSYYKVDEVVTTTYEFHTSVACRVLIRRSLKDPMASMARRSVIDEGVLPQIISRTRLHFGFIVAIGTTLIICCYYLEQF